MKTVDVLIKARELVATTGDTGWTRHAVYRTASGSTTEKLSEATCFCSIGGITGALGLDRTCGVYGLKASDRTPSFLRAVKYLGNAYNTLFPNEACLAADDGGDMTAAIPYANDSLSDHGTVLKAFDLAIKRAKRRHPHGDRKKAVSL